MDALRRADRTLARALARRDGIVTPDSATSPMDEASTVRLPRATITAADSGERDPESTLVMEPVTSDPSGRQQR